MHILIFLACCWLALPLIRIFFPLAAFILTRKLTWIILGVAIALTWWFGVARPNPDEIALDQDPSYQNFLKESYRTGYIGGVPSYMKEEGK